MRLRWLPFLLLAAPLAAQSRPPQAGLEVLYPTFEGGGVRVLLVTASLDLPMASWGDFTVAVPLGHARPDAGGAATDTRVGNIWVGLSSRMTAATQFEFGVFVPVMKHAADDYLEGAAFLGDFDRFEAFMPDLLSIRARARSRTVSPTGLLLQGYLGATVMKNREANTDAETFADYAGGIGLVTPTLEFSTGVSGRFLLTEDGTFGERSVHQVTLAIAAASGRVRPTAWARIPLDTELNDFFNLAVGAGVRVTLR